MNKKLKTVILAGGSGTRLWPISTKNFPKQFSINIKNKSLFQLSVERAMNLSTGDLVISCNADHEFIVLDQLQKINKDFSLIVEPVSRNTLATFCISALTHEAEDILLFLPSDHVIKDIRSFKKSINKAINASKLDKIVCFGIKPNSPSVNFGYIKSGKGLGEAFEVKGFYEKPNITKARKFIKDNTFFWNSGIFVIKAGFLLKELELHQPALLKKIERLVKENTDPRHVKLNKSGFEKIKANSFDYGVVEKSKSILMVKADFKWDDLGTWSSYKNYNAKDKNNNLLEGNVIASETKNTFIKSKDKPIIAFGIDNQLIIDSPDAIFVGDLNKTNQIKSLMHKIDNSKIDSLKEINLEVRPWGSFETIYERTGYKVKKISVKPKQQLSLQLHNMRSEHWVIVEGRAKVTIGNKTINLKKNQDCFIPRKTKHSVRNPSSEDLIFIEVQIGEYLGEDDIKRFKDIYNRT